MASTRKPLVALTNALLEWLLILMLLLNSFLSYLITKFATYNSLNPPCFFCSMIYHSLDPKNCEKPCQNNTCGSRNPKGEIAAKIEANYDENEEVEVVKVHVENRSGHIQVFDQIIPLEWTDSSTSGSRCSSLDGDEKTVVNDECFVGKQGCQQDEDEEEEDKAVTIDSLTAKLKAERLVMCGLYMELDEERNASAIAANQAMAMITKLQEEKVAIQIESVQNQRMIDEQAEYDREVFQLLNELVMKLENDKLELENELEMCKQKILRLECKNIAKTTPRCPLASCNNAKESMYDVNVVNVSVLKNLRTCEESVVEFDMERVWKLDELKELDGTPMTLTNKVDRDLVGIGSLREDLGRVFDIEGVAEKAEASHSAWSLSSF